MQTEVQSIYQIAIWKNAYFASFNGAKDLTYNARSE